MANITTTERARKIFWFVALWMAGVGGTMLLALQFELLSRAGAAIH